MILPVIICYEKIHHKKPKKSLSFTFKRLHAVTFSYSLKQIILFAMTVVMMMKTM